VCVRTCFVGCLKVRPLLSTESTSQSVSPGPSAPPSRAHIEAHALAQNHMTHQIKRPREQSEDQIQNAPKVTPQDDLRRKWQLDHVLQTYHLAYHGGHLISEPQEESATSITVQHTRPLLQPMFAPKSHSAEHLLHLRVFPFNNDTQPDYVGVVRLSLACYIAGVRELHPHSQHVRAVLGQK